MPTVTAGYEDSLCSIAVAHRFPNCRALRRLPENRAYLDRALEPGDRVRVPDCTGRDDPGRGTEICHEYEAEGPPLPRIRFVHGSPSGLCSADPSEARLNISNYRTDWAGVPDSSARPFPRHTTSAFNANAHADVDAFKVEVFDPRAGAGPINVDVVAREPIYNAAGRITGYRNFTGADAADRQVNVQCRRVGSEPQRYRSCYLRLVVDEVDKARRRPQTILVSDRADGAGTANDRLEILDQRIRAQYPISTCPASPGTHRCHAVADVPVGDDNRLKIRVQAHILRTAPGGARVGGLTQANVRRHVLKWVRRTYAQANMGVKPSTPDVDEVDPVENLISIFNQSRNLTTGGRVIRVSVNTAPATTEVRHNTVAGETPIQIATDLANQINALADFRARAFTNPTAWNNALSADILVFRTDGARVVLTGANSTDPRTRIGIGRVRPNRISTPTDNYLFVGARDHRTLARNHAVRSDFSLNPNHARDAVHLYVIGAFRQLTVGAWIFTFFGWACPRDRGQANQYQNIEPLVGSCFVRWRELATNDHRCHVVSHEFGHILGDQFHFSFRRRELMTDQAAYVNNHINDMKRLTHRDLRYRRTVGLQGGFTPRTTIHPVDTMRTREAGWLENWPR